MSWARWKRDIPACFLSATACTCLLASTLRRPAPGPRWPAASGTSATRTDRQLRAAAPRGAHRARVQPHDPGPAPAGRDHARRGQVRLGRRRPAGDRAPRPSQPRGREAASAAHPAAPSRPRPSQPPGTRAGAPPAHCEPGPPSPGPNQATHAGRKPARTATNHTPHRTPRQEKVMPPRAGGPAVQALRADCPDRRAPSKSAREVASRSDRRICECYKRRSVADRLTLANSIFLTSQATGQRPGGSARRPTEDTVW
jgi:hypothetical protein